MLREQSLPPGLALLLSPMTLRSSLESPRIWAGPAVTLRGELLKEPLASTHTQAKKEGRSDKSPFPQPPMVYLILFLKNKITFELLQKMCVHACVWFAYMCFVCMHLYLHVNDLPVMWLLLAHTNSRRPTIKFLGIFAT